MLFPEQNFWQIVAKKMASQAIDRWSKNQIN